MKKDPKIYTAGKETTNILCFGDSNTYGFNPNPYSYRYPEEKRWVNILADKLGSGYVVAAEGLNGRTTAYDRPGAPWKNGASTLVPCLATHKPVDILVIMLGTNDCIKEMGLSAQEIADGMESLVRITEEMAPEIQGYVPEIIVIAPGAIRADYANGPFADELDDESVRKSHEIADLYDKVLDKHHCVYIDATEDAEVSPLDAMHLSEEGHRTIAELVYKHIRNIEWE